MKLKSKVKFGGAAITGYRLQAVMISRAATQVNGENPKIDQVIVAESARPHGGNFRQALVVWGVANGKRQRRTRPHKI